MGSFGETVLPPSKLAHVVLQTNKYDHMKRFYTQFLGGKIVNETEALAFITYDEEHHRIALLNLGPDGKDKDFRMSGLVHVAFTFDNLKDLCTAYKQRKALGIEPGWCVNHGATTSMYYRDPDGNQLETQVDNCSPEEASKMMSSPDMAKNPFGADFDPEELCAAIDRGEDEATLMVKKDVGPRGPAEIPALLERINNAPCGV